MKKVFMAFLLVGIFAFVGLAGTPNMTGTADFWVTYDKDGLGMEESLRFGRFDLNLSGAGEDGTGYSLIIRFPGAGYSLYRAYAYHEFSLTEEMSLTAYFGRYNKYNSNYPGFWASYAGFSRTHDGVALTLDGKSGDVSYSLTPYLYVFDSAEASPALGVDLFGGVDLNGVSLRMNAAGLTEGATDMILEANVLVALNDFIDIPVTIDLFAAYKTETNFTTNTVNTVVTFDFDPVSLINEFTIVLEKDKDAVMVEELDVSYGFMDAYAVGLYSLIPLEDNPEMLFEPYFSATFDALSYYAYLDFYIGGETPTSVGARAAFSF